MKTLINVNHEQIDRLGLILAPVFTDGCQHEPGSYVCSFVIEPHRMGQPRQFYDLYVFANNYYGLEVCIRTGNEAHEYISPGGLLEFMRSAGAHGIALPEYGRAAEIIRNFYKVDITRRSL